MPSGGIRPPCSVVGCPNLNHCNGLCKKHYRTTDNYRAGRREYRKQQHVRDKRREHNRKFRSTRPELWIEKNLKKLGLTVESRAEMLANQRNCCAICGDSIAFGRAYDACVDHCHTTGRVRGILCAPCNLAIGKMKDSPERLRRAAEYLERST